MNSLWSKDELDIIRKYYGKIKTKEIANILNNRSCFSIRRKASQLKIKGNHRLNNKHSHNKYIFDNPNITNCYWAGFIAADGFVRKSSRSVQLGIMLSHVDKDILIHFQNFIEFTGTIDEGERDNHKYARINIYSAHEIVKALQNNWNIVPRKSLILQPPNIQGTNALSYIKGYIDGDGTIAYRRDKKYKKEKILILQALGTINLMDWINKTLTEYIPYAPYKQTKPIYKHGKIFNLKYLGQRAEDVCELLTSVKTPYELNRKWQKYYDYSDH